MFRFSLLKSVLSVLAAVFSGVAFAAASLVVELSSEASRPAINDLVQATVSAEATGTTPGELSKQINQSIAEALKVSKAYPSIKAKSGNTNTLPVYTKSGKIESWRMRSDILLESSDPASLSELLGKLQASLGVSSLTMIPSPDTRRKAENEAMLDAIAMFKARAKTLAEALGKTYTIQQLSVSNASRFIPPTMRAASKAMTLSSETVMPVEAGESLVTVVVTGKIGVE